MTRGKMICGRCGEAHTNDCLNLYSDPKTGEVVERVCFFCDHGVEVGPKNGATPGRYPDGRPAETATREEDRLEAEAYLSEHGD